MGGDRDGEGWGGDSTSAIPANITECRAAERPPTTRIGLSHELGNNGAWLLRSETPQTVGSRAICQDAYINSGRETRKKLRYDRTSFQARVLAGSERSVELHPR